MQTAETLPAAPRYISLDAMRGFAVMGILAMNIIAFAMPEWAYITPMAFGGETQADKVSWFFSFVFIDGKMRGLFSLLFGASMMLIIQSAQAKGESAAKVHFSRMGWLAVFGLIHFFFIWFGDILFSYAVAGCFAYLFRNWTPRRLVKWALIILAIGLAVFGAMFGGMQVLQIIATAPGASAEIVEQYQKMLSSEDFDFNIAKELALHRSSYTAIVTAKFSEWYTPISGAALAILSTLPLMMMGMAAQKHGFITGDWEHRRYVRWALWLCVPGFGISAILAATVMLLGYDKINALAVFMLWNIVPQYMLTIGYSALMILLIKRYQNSKFIKRVAAAGQAAFTNYLGTSIVMTTIFYGYGFGLYGYAGRAQLWLFVIGAWTVMLLWPRPWLIRYRYGPLEWLWRSLSRLQLQPMQRS